MEASGTGNMKFALNGALTIGTDDGANVEIRQLVGDDHFFLFGMVEPEVAALQVAGYRPTEYYESDPDLKSAIDLISSGAFSKETATRSSPSCPACCTTTGSWRWPTTGAYLDAQAQVEARYADEEAWTRSAILNVARSGFFSSDRSMRDYLSRIWGARPDN